MADLACCHVSRSDLGAFELRVKRPVHRLVYGDLLELMLGKMHVHVFALVLVSEVSLVPAFAWSTVPGRVIALREQPPDEEAQEFDWSSRPARGSRGWSRRGLPGLSRVRQGTL